MLDYIILPVAQRKKGTWGGPRKGAGRPRLIKDPVDRWVRLECKDAEKAEQLAARQGISLSELTRRALRSYVKRHRRR